MNLPFSGEEIAAFIALIGSAAGAYADLRGQLKGLRESHVLRHDALKSEKDQLEDRVESLEAEVAELKEGQLSVALLEQTVNRFESTVASMNSEHKATREAMVEMGKSLVRIETKMESGPLRAAQ